MIRIRTRILAPALATLLLLPAGLAQSRFRSVQGSSGPSEPDNVDWTAPMEVHLDLSYSLPNVPRPEQRIDIYQKPDLMDGPSPLVLFVHGGYFFSGNEDTVVTTAPYQTWLNRGWTFATMHYRLAPKDCDEACDGTSGDDHMFPEPQEDVALAVQYLKMRAADFNLDTEKFMLWGKSAGATLSMWVAMTPDGYPLTDGIGHAGISTHVRGVVNTAGITDFTYENPLKSLDKAHFNYFDGCHCGEPFPPTSLLAEASPYYQAQQLPSFDDNQLLAIRHQYRGPVGGDLHDPYYGQILHSVLVDGLGSTNSSLDWNFGPEAPTGMDPLLGLTDWIDLQFSSIPFGQGTPGTVPLAPTLTLVSKESNSGGLTLLLGNAPAGRTVVLYRGIGAASSAFANGNWLISPQTMAFSTSDLNGEVLFEIDPKAIPGNGPIFLQAFVQDPLAQYGYAKSHGLRLDR